MFFQSAKQYNQNAKIQHEIASQLVLFAKHKIARSSTILDVGCGTGFVGLHINKIYNNKTLHGLDRSIKMTDLSSSYYSKFFHSKIEDFSVPKYDLFLSSMCFQWVCDLELQINKISQIGDLFFAMPLQNNLNEANQAFIKSGIESPLIKDQKLKIKPDIILEYKEQYSSILKLLKSFNLIGAINKKAKKMSHNQIKKVDELFNGVVTWKIGLFEVRKNTIL